MDDTTQNYYGSLCAEMYELLHAQPPHDELAFYLSYAKRGQKILEPLCGSGRFLVPFLEQGFDICGFDSSRKMLDKLLAKAPKAPVRQADALRFSAREAFDYIFIPSGSISLFTDINACKKVLRSLRSALAPEGVLVLSADSVSSAYPDDADYTTVASERTGDGAELVLKMKHRYDAASQTQFLPSRYERYREGELLHSEYMDFQTHLYRFGEMEAYLEECGFATVTTYASYAKDLAADGACELYLYECRA